MTSNESPPDFLTPVAPPTFGASATATSGDKAHGEVSALLDAAEEVRSLAQADLYTFARLVNPSYHYGDIHRQVFKFLQTTSHPNQLLLLPRSHMKSHCIATWCAWYITNNPATSIIYVSATTTLAEAQLYAIKNIFLGDAYQRYWPTMINPEEGKREKWANGAISVDHPTRREEQQRDYTIFASGLTTNTAGLHCEVLVADDVVVPSNAYTVEGRSKTAAAMSQFASVLNAGGVIKACGTRYHPADQYHVWQQQVMDTLDPRTQEIVGSTPIWQTLQHSVEIDGRFLWPRSARPSDGKLFGFDQQELSRINGMYTDRMQFHAQYYNEPNAPESNRVAQDRFQYYDPKYLTNEYGTWYYNGEKLRLTAGIDFAFATNARADFTAIAVIGVTAAHDIYILELDRFKTDRIQVYYEHIDTLHQKWGFSVLRAEVTAAQSIIVTDLKERIKSSGASIKIDPHRPTGRLGSKAERIAAVLEPRYDNLQIWHYQGGYIPMLESEVILANPKNDDLKDVLAFTIEGAKAPRERQQYQPPTASAVQHHPRFGGVM